jgi:hypothetical protein
METTFNYDGVNYNPDADGSIENMDYGGLTIESVVQELLDNSLEYLAKNIDVYLLSDGTNTNGIPKKSLHQLIIMDDGPGMTAEKLSQAIIMAKKHPHLQGAIGKFGMGLKNSTMAMGNKITIIVKTADGCTRGLHMDLISMRRNKTFKPTKICEGVEHFKDYIDRAEICEKFLAQKSGVLIDIQATKMNIEDIESAASNLRIYLGLGYTEIRANIQIHTLIPNSLPKSIHAVDVFYKNNPSHLDYESETTVRVYLEMNRVSNVIEILKGNRIKSLKQKIKFNYYKGTHNKPLFLKHQRRPTEQKKGKKFTLEEVEEPGTKHYYDINVRFICIKENAYSKENDDGIFDDEQVIPNRRRGVWYYRGIRCVGKCVPIGSSLDDYSNRQRMEVIYPSDLDYHMGMRIQKQMSSITSTMILDTLTHIWEEQNNTIIKKRKEENRLEKERKKLEKEKLTSELDDSESVISESTNNEDLVSTECSQSPNEEYVNTGKMEVPDSPRIERYTKESKTIEQRQQKKREKEKEVVQEEKEKEVVQEEKKKEVVQEEKEKEVVQEEKEKEVVQEEKEKEVVQEEKKKEVVQEEKKEVVQEEKEKEVVQEEKAKEIVQEEKEKEVVQEEKDNIQIEEEKCELALEEGLCCIESRILVTGYERTTTKCEKDVLQICNQLLISLQTNLKLKNTTNVATSEFTELYKSAILLINYLNK